MRVGSDDDDEDEDVFPLARPAAPAGAAGTAIQVHPEQQRVNQYILAEIAKIKKDNKRLNDEVLALRMENMTLNSRLSTIAHPPLPLEFDSLGAPSSSSSSMVAPFLNKPQQELPFVEFDMRKQPPTVQSANVMFCSLLGYKTEEVLGKPWQYFIQDDFIERTIRMLQRDGGAGGTKQMQFSQMYKDRNGRPVPAQDLHTFNRDEKGRVITDYVIVRPEGVPEGSRDAAPLALFGGMQQPQLSAKRPVPSIMGSGVELGTSPLQMMEESDGEGPTLPFPSSPSPPPMPLGVSAEWDSSFLPWDPEKAT